MDENSKTVATLENGEVPPVNLPATFMGPQEAEALRKYQGWLEHNDLCAQLECGVCGTICRAFVTTGDIGIFCDCRVLVSKVS